MSTDSSRERTQRYRLRLAGLPDLAAPPPCPACGRLVRSARTGPLCSRCWKRTEEGRRANRDRMRAVRSGVDGGGTSQGLQGASERVGDD